LPTLETSRPIAFSVSTAGSSWKTPEVKVAQVVVDKQELNDDDPAEAACNKLIFTPWHALVAHRPLGNIMRARNVAYRSSTQARKAIAEPREAPSFE